MVLFGLSQNNINAQCSVDIQVLSNQCGEAFLYASAQNPLYYQWSTGSNNAFVQISNSGSYSVTVCCTNGEFSQANIWINVAPPCTPCSGEIKSTEYCGYTKLEVNGGVACVWNTGATANSINVTNPGTYIVTATCSNGSSFVAQKTIASIKKLEPTVSGNNKVCTGEKTTLTANGGISYHWSTGANTAAVSVGKGFYYVTVTDVNGCTGAVTTEVIELPVPIAPTITSFVNASGEVTLISNASTGNIWNTGENTQIIKPTTSGLYTVSVVNSAGCKSLPGCGSNIVVAIKIVEKIKEVPVPVYIDTCIGGGNSSTSLDCYTDKVYASNWMKYGDQIPQNMIYSTVQLFAPVEDFTKFKYEWSYGYNPKNNYIYIGGEGTTLGGHTYWANLKEIATGKIVKCYEFKYFVIGPCTGNLTGTAEESETRERQDFNAYPNPTFGPVEIDLSDFPSGIYMINVVSASGQKITKKVIKQ